MPERKTYDTNIGGKYNSPLAKGLRKLIPDSKTANDLKDYLDVSIQAINQYKQGTAYPKTENLIKIAEYFGISVDYLLGFTDTPNRDTTIQAINQVTGLSVNSICKLAEMKLDKRKAFCDIISLLIENPNADYFIAIIAGMISCSYNGTENDPIEFSVDGNIMHTSNWTYLTTVLQSQFLQDIPGIVDKYKEHFEIEPLQESINGGVNNAKH